MAYATAGKCRRGGGKWAEAQRHRGGKGRAERADRIARMHERRERRAGRKEIASQVKSMR